MHIEPKPATVKNPPEQFTGDVWLDLIASPKDESQRMVVATVRFTPGARTAWHSHPKGQTLHVTQGVALMQARGGEILGSMVCVIGVGLIMYAPRARIVTPAGRVAASGSPSRPEPGGRRPGVCRRVRDDPGASSSLLEKPVGQPIHRSHVEEHPEDNRAERQSARCSPLPSARATGANRPKQSRVLGRCRDRPESKGGAIGGEGSRFLADS
jgi:hypothetical protein